MRIAGGITIVLSLVGAVSASLRPRSHDTRDYFALHLDPAIPPSQVAQVLGARHEGQIGELTDHHTFSLPRDENSHLDTLLDDWRAKRQLRRRSGNKITSRSSRNPLDGILWSQKLAPRQRLKKRIPPPPVAAVARSNPRNDKAAEQARAHVMKTLGISDPIFEEQWHLHNVERPEHDLNVTGIWLEGVTGKGIITAVIDDGLDMDSKDLKSNYFAEGSYDFNDDDPEPRPELSDDRHGTRCAGEIAAAKNNVCGVGVAFDSKVAGIRILSKAIDDVHEAEAINFGYQKNDIYSCSWGPPDDGATMDAPGVLIKRAMVNGVQKGRGGKGSIFVFAAGNGAMSGDNCNFDGYTNSIYSITVGAIDREGNHPSYSESCSAQLVVAYSSGSGDAIHTTDVGSDKCYSMHGGTSAAGPLAAGAVALALSVRPELTWRDLQYLMVETAVPVNEDDGSWQVTSSGRKFSHDWGFGKVDTYSLVARARSWEFVKPQAWYDSPWLRVHREIPQGDKGLLSRINVTAEQIKKANFARLEHVTVTMNVNHTRRGDLSVEMRSPGGTTSHLSVTRDEDNANAGYVDWTFMSVAHWGETPVGEWTVIVKDTEVNNDQGTFIDWRINLWGEAIDGSKQPLHPLPDLHDDDHPYEDAPVATTTVATGPTKTSHPNPDEHHDRPVNEKPGQPTPTKPAADQSTPAASPSSSAAASNYISSYLPSFGASKRTQVWIYASLAMIIVFFIGLGIYFQLQRHKHRRTNPQDDYEFEMIEDEDEMHPMTGAPGRSQRRGGELYNAFAGESDEEMFSDDDDSYGDGAANTREKDGEHDISQNTRLLSEK
ncbi:hypothetical protein NUU61_008070 [Penicillium alfredii]|uniref:P/Homo B domain-containing protein n=1 Tax=Penicillium alfredii TaxID=1506179 RepID=A0A9W9ERN4_9EURO|nr:uncharacterized protein NUU61_008070 [Penicillium alfredii]KAJ5086763.1 hypothetical protein NUU61_008070 [Penicillium alfredii]